MNPEDAACNVEPAGSDAGINTISSLRDAAIDRLVLDKLNTLVARGSGEPFAVRAARLYLKTSASLVASMEGGLIAQDAKAVYFAVHTLKSSSNSLGARVLGRMAADLEMLTHRGTLDGAASQVEELSREYRRVCNELNEFIDDLTREISA